MLTDYRRIVLYLEAVEVGRLTEQVGCLARKKPPTSAQEFGLAMMRRDEAIENYQRLVEMWTNGKK